MRLIILNYSMNPTSLIFSHQRQVAIKLSRIFDETLVITADSNIGPPIPNLKVISTNWSPGSKVKSIFRYLSVVFPIVWRNRNSVIFSHMTEVQSFLIAPLCRFLRIPHFLWYAHKNKSLYLQLSTPFLSGVVTSTSGSCPISGSKVMVIGQGVEVESAIKATHRESIKALDWYHVSRIDSSKRIELLIEVIHAIRQDGMELKLDIFGLPSGPDMEEYNLQLKKINKEFIDDGWLRFLGQLKRADSNFVLERYGGFVHAFQGSLDKTLIEATLSRKFVVTVNNEYKREFGLNQGSATSDFQDLVNQILEFLVMSCAEREAEIDRRFEIAKSRHSLDGWVDRLGRILQSDGARK